MTYIDVFTPNLLCSAYSALYPHSLYIFYSAAMVDVTPENGRKLSRSQAQLGQATCLVVA